MNITIITCVLPWKLQSGGAQAQFNMIDQLRKKHHITLIFPEDFQSYTGLRRFFWSGCLQSLLLSSVTVQDL